MNEIDYPAVNHLIGSFDRYLEHGIMPGSFLTAVLHNDLQQAFAKADVINRFNMFEIVSYVYNELPADSHGSPEAVKSYAQKVRERRLNSED